jgi:hypothetical protein
MMERLWEKGRVEMGQLATRLEGRVDARAELEEGLPAEIIVDKSKAYDLVVVGKKRSHGRWSLFARHTAPRVAREAFCPVLVVGEDELHEGSTVRVVGPPSDSPERAGHYPLRWPDFFSRIRQRQPMMLRRKQDEPL